MLEPLPPTDAVEQYLNHRKTELAQSSLQNHRYRLQRFLEWCEINDIQNMNDISGRSLHEYKQWRSEDVNTMTLRAQLSTIHVFIRFCENIEAVESGVSEKILIPQVDYENERRTDLLTSDEAEDIQAHLNRYEYATLRHALFEVLWHTGVRTGTVRTFDLEDFHPEERYLAVKHRPKTATPLKK